MSGVWFWVRSDTRRRARSLVVLALIVTVSVAVVLSAVAGARRNSTALTRLFERSRPATVMAVPNTPGFDWNRVRRLPYVETVGEFLLAGIGIKELPVGHDGFLPATPETYVDVERGVIISGRRANEARVDEVVMSPNAKKFGLHLGSKVHLQTWRADKIADYVKMPAPPQPDGPTVEATVVGVVKSPFAVAYGGDDGGVLPTHAFFLRYHANALPFIGVPVNNALIRLRHGTRDVPALSAELDQIAKHPVEITRAGVITKPVRDANHLEGNALFGFALAAAVAAFVLLVQAIVRMVASAAIDMPTLQSFGMTRGGRALALAVAPAVAVAAGVLAAVPLAYASSGLFPIGSGRQVEPAPGRSPDWLVLGGGTAFALMILVGAVAAVAVWYVWRGERVRTRRQSAIVAAVARTSAPLPVAFGTQLALERGQGRSSVPVRPAIIGAIVGVLGVVGALTFRTGLERASADPKLYGQQFAAGISGVSPDDIPRSVLAQLVGDRDLPDVNETRVSVLEVGGRTVTFFESHPLKGTTRIVTTAGRPPNADDEVALAPDEMKNLHAHVGETVRIGPANAMFRVVGTAFTPEDSHTSYNQGGWLDEAALRRADPHADDLKYYRVLFTVRPGVSVAKTVDRVGKATQQDAEPMNDPAPLYYLKNVRKIPFALGAFLTLLAIAAVGHALASAVRRRRRDIAVLRALGITRRQARASVAWQATTLAVIGLVAGIPLGVFVGRWIWESVADLTPVKYVAPIALVAVVVAVPAALVVANLLAAVPGHRAARLRAAEVLRTE